MWKEHFHGQASAAPDSPPSSTVTASTLHTTTSNGELVASESWSYAPSSADASAASPEELAGAAEHAPTAAPPEPANDAPPSAWGAFWGSLGNSYESMYTALAAGMLDVRNIFTEENIPTEEMYETAYALGPLGQTQDSEPVYYYQPFEAVTWM